MEKSNIKINSEKYLNRLKKVNEYNKEHYKVISFRLDYVKDRDIIDFLENIESNKTYICALIRESIGSKYD